MGNYLLSLRAPPPGPEEDERNHPLYYDWTIPKWSPFLERKPSLGDSVEKDGNKREFLLVDATRDSQKDINKGLAKQVRNEMKDKLTSTVDTASTKPPNLGTHKGERPSAGKTVGGGGGGSQIAKSTQLHKNTNANGVQVSQQAAKAMKSHDSGSSVKRVDSTRPHTVDPKKYGQMEDSAAIKSATNIHAIKVAKKTSSSS